MGLCVLTTSLRKPNRRRAGAELVHLILVWPCSTRTHIGGLFYTVRGSVRSTTGIGPRANLFLLYTADLLQLKRHIHKYIHEASI